MDKLNLASMSTGSLLLPGGYACSCGRRHASSIQNIVIGEHVLDQLVSMALSLNMTHPVIISDTLTYEAAGQAAVKLLSEAGIRYTSYIMDSSHPDPSEYWVGAITMRYEKAWDGIIGIGSGVINDICKIIAGSIHLPFIIVATAPSMDGYASDTSSMVLSGLKVSIPSHCADMILADTSIISRAPIRMLQSGLGDMAAKYTSICEWRISHLINGEYYCEEVAALVRRSLEQCMASSEHLMQRDPEAAGHIMNGLILSGIAMSYAGISRPASGTEHYFSHFWDMSALDQGYEHDLHGIQCGIGTLLTLKIFDYIRALNPSREKAVSYVNQFSPDQWEAGIYSTFGAAAPSIIKQEQKEQKYNKDAHNKRLETIIASWDSILNIMEEELPSYDWLQGKLKAAGAPTKPEELHLSAGLVKASFTGTKDIRDKYISTRLLWDLGVLEEAAEILI